MRRAIRNAWHGKARRKSCAAKADSRSGSANVPVMGCIVSTSESCALPVDIRSYSLPPLFPRFRTPAVASIRVAVKPLDTGASGQGGDQLVPS
eukprot:scaffold84976_cov60-Phaeocystis_antarctica.AAC.4